MTTRDAGLRSSDPYAPWRYTADLPTDRTAYGATWKLFESYSHIPREEIDGHVVAIRNKAFATYQYPCLGRWRFLELYLKDTPQYPAIVSRLNSGERLLDVGCCVGQILRQLVVDGAPSENLAGTDLRSEFIDIGYELFRDRSTFRGKFIAGDVFAAEGPLEEFEGGFDILHAASLFHLFSWNDQVKLGVRLVKFFKPSQKKALLVGRQVGTRTPESPEVYRKIGQGVEWVNDRKTMHNHDVGSMQALWDEIGEKTGEKWKVSGRVYDLNDEEEKRCMIEFAVERIG